MKYNGQELTPITTPQIIDPPREMLVWDGDCDKPCKREVVAIVANKYRLLCVIGKESVWRYCAEIPEEPKPKRATYLQLAKWVANGNGFWKRKNESAIHTHASFFEDLLEEEVEECILIRPFGTDKWLEPTLENMGMEE